MSNLLQKERILTRSQIVEWIHQEQGQNILKLYEIKNNLKRECSHCGGKLNYEATYFSDIAIIKSECRCGGISKSILINWEISIESIQEDTEMMSVIMSSLY